MKKLNVLCSLIILMIGFVSFTSCSFAATIKGNGRLTTRTLSIADYDQVSIAGSMDVEYSIGSSPTLEFTLDENLVQFADIYVQNKTLFVSFKKNKNNYSPTKFIVKTSSSSLTKVSLAGSGDFKANTPIIAPNNFAASLAGSGDIVFPKSLTCQSADISVAGSGDIRFTALEAQGVKASVAGSGDIKLKGTANKATYSVSGSGDIDAYQMKVEVASASLAGSGDLKLYASKKVNASGASSGDIYIKGNPEVTKSWVGSGDIHMVK